MYRNECGDKFYYICKGFLICKKIVYIHLHVDSLKCTIYQSKEEHSHNLNKNKIDQRVIDLVRDCLNDKVSSNSRIMEKIREKLLPQITTKQLNNLKSRLKEKKHGKSSTNLIEIIEDYKYIFQTLKNLSINFKYEFNPTILLADTAAEITNGFKKVFNLGNLFITFFINIQLRNLKIFFSFFRIQN